MSEKDGLTHIPKGTILQRPGEFGGCVYEVQSGLLRSYVIDQKGKEHIYLFGPAGWVVGDSTMAEDPNALYIEALEDTVAKVTRKTDLLVDMPVTLDAERLLVLFRRMFVLQQRILMLMSATALERYEHFVETYPDILQRVPQRMVASYLGLTPEALSKVKNEALRGIS